MKRILMVLAAAAPIVAMMALSAVPSFAQVVADENDLEAEAGDAVIAVAGAKLTATFKLYKRAIGA